MTDIHTGVTVPVDIYRMMRATLVRLDLLMQGSVHPHMRSGEYCMEHLNVKDLLRMLPPTPPTESKTFRGGST